MAKILEHSRTYPTYERYRNEWLEPASIISPPKLTAEEAWMQEYEIRLEHFVRYRIAHEAEKPHAEDAAKQRLIAHLYGEQRAIAHNALSAIHSGSSKKEVIELLIRLLESMK